MKVAHLAIGLMAVLSATVMSCRKDLNDTVAPATAKGLTAGVTAANWSNNNWMTAIPDNTVLSALTIPGTHDSGARNEPFPGTAKTQTLSIGDQLNAGIRFLDVRCRHIGDAFAIHHGSIYQNLNFDDVLNACFAFLASNPGETIVMSVKEEYDPTNNTRSFEATFDSYVAKNPGGWYLGATIPQLSTVRGKIVLLRRFSSSNTKGIDASAWADNTTFSINNSNANLRIQDQYQVPDNNGKWNVITSLFNEATSGNSATLYINFTSGYKSMIFGIPSITTVSDDINGRLDSYFSTAAHARYGIIPMDFATADRAGKMITTNF
ncbi:phosphatidylinositol-specific phospholipase C [Chitinophaga vietnamensis]|uniref:phosphatidylinositol-specific phospholipase C n=1 Tax=Chitinophaga vietnamensis TaxID=2593957 RepID=UPI001F4371E3|nr:phosphatidylinositol-specific phospholipase C [Chitinophaga vietnamensis]